MGANVIAVNNETSVLDGFGISNDNGYFSINLKNGTEFNINGDTNSDGMNNILDVILLVSIILER